MYVIKVVVSLGWQLRRKCEQVSTALQMHRGESVMFFLWRSWLRELQPSRRRQCNIWFLREPTLYRIDVGMYVRGLYGHVYVKGCDSNFEVYFFKLQKLLHFLSRSALSFGIIYWRNDYVYFKCSCVLTWIHNLTEKIEGLLCYTRVKQGWTHQNDVS